MAHRDETQLTTNYVAMPTDPAHDKIESYFPKTIEGHARNSYSLWNVESIAIPMTYVCLAFMDSFPRAYIEYYPRTINSSDAQLSTILVVRSLPWTFKIIFGILPDNFPLKQLRFKPYMLLGYAISSVFHLVISIYSESLSIESFTLLLLGGMIGMVMADVMGDALVTTRVLRREEESSGHTQSVVYSCRYFSQMIGYWLGAFVSNPSQWGFGLSMRQVFGFIAILPLVTIVPCIWMLKEPSIIQLSSWRHQVELLWIMLQRRATWQPLCFVAMFNMFFVHNSSWGNYLTVAYKFDAFHYGAMAAISATVTFGAVLWYRHWVQVHHPNAWHHVYFVTGVITALFSMLNVLLVFHVNEIFDIHPFWFAVGDSAVISFAKGLQELPLALMLVTVCPENQEGVGFALLTSVTNLSHAFANTVSNMLLQIWPVELPDLIKGNYSGVWKLTVLTSVVSLFPLLFTKQLLPKGLEEQIAMKHELSIRGAQLVIVMYACGFLWVTILSLLAVVSPCNVLVGGHGC